MKKLAVSLLSIVVSTLCVVSAGNIAVENVSSMSSCTSTTIYRNIYLSSGYTASDSPWDTFKNTVDSLIKKGATSVQIWRNGVITDCNDWNTSSIVVASSDSDGASIIVNKDGCDFNKPNYTKAGNSAKIDAQIHYTVGYARIWESGTLSYNKKLYHKNYTDTDWTCYPGGNRVIDNQECPNVNIKYMDETRYHVGECINYRVFRCGDGLINGYNGSKDYDNDKNNYGVYKHSYTEECDPNDPNKEGWKNNGKTCNASCKLETIHVSPVCDSEYNGKTKYTTTSEPWLTAGKCSTGTPKGFTYSGSPRTFTWSCENDGETVDGCVAYQEWCGDKKKNGTEECDPNDPNKEGWKDNGKTCNASCKLETIHVSPVCDSEYNGKTKYTTTSEPWLTAGKCSKGTPKGFTYSGSPRTFTWSCENDGETVDGCIAYQEWCGDKKKNGTEECDPNDPNKEGWKDNGKTCNASCKLETIHVSPVCDSEYNGKTKYTTTSEPWLTAGKCSKGTPKGFTYSGSPRTFTWSCENDGETVDGCVAYQEWCGDGKKNGTEECDPNDPNKEGWKDNGKTCNASCKLETIHISPVCDSEYNGKTKYTTTSEPWLTAGKCSKGTPKGFTYSGSPRTFTWSCENDGETVDGCVAYQEWCGDGKKNGTEECDPNDPNKEGWKDNGKTCDSSCKLGDISKPACGSISTEYNSDYPTPRITTTTPGLCKEGTLVEGSLTGPDDEGKYIWKCKKNGIETDYCPARDLWCGDGKKNGSEECDPNDPNKEGWKDNGKTCNASCKLESLPQPNLWIKKTFTDGSKTKTVKIGDLVGYKISFGNNGNASATITSIKDFLPKNIEYVSSKIYIIDGNNSHLLSGSEVIDTNRKVDGVYVDIYGGITLEANTEGYIILTGKVLSGNQDNRTNFACIYLNNKKVECDDVIHDIAEELMCTKPKIEKTSFGSGGGSTTVECKTSPSGEKAEIIELDCGNGTKYTGSNISSLNKTCTYQANTTTGSKSYSVVCTVNGKTKEECKSTVIVEGKNGDELMCTKPEIEKTSFGSGGGSTTVECKTSPSGENAEAIELDCGNGTKYTGSNVSILKRICIYPANTTTGSKSYSVVCTVNGKTKEECKSTVTVEGKKGDELMCTAPKGIYNLGSDGGETQLTCDVSPSGEKAETIELDCGNGTKYTGSNISSLSGTCKYPRNDSNTAVSYTARCKVNNKTVDECKSIIYVAKKPEDNPITKEYPKCKSIKINTEGYVECYADKKKAHFKLECDGKLYYYNKSYERSHEFSECKRPRNATCYVEGKDGWESDSSCEKTPPPPTQTTCEDEDRKNDPICLFADPKCYNVNEGNISIEKGEILPFYLNIQKDKSKWNGGAYIYAYFNPNVYIPGDKANYQKMLNDNEECLPGTVALNSAICSYVIKGNNNHIVFTGEGACLDDGASMTKTELIKAWVKWQNDTYGQLQSYNDGNGYTYASRVETIDTNSNDRDNGGKYGELSFQVNKVKYLQCDENGEWKEGTTDSVCQSNFVFTDSYTVQKTPSGNLSASTMKLSNFKYLNGAGVFSDLLNAIQSTTYEPTTGINNVMSGFVNKYKKLAVKVDLSRSRYLIADKASKVPGKDIYFVEGDITIKGGNRIRNPFTIVQVTGDTTIIGDIDHNIMLLTYGNIIFSGNCTTNQKVKGIYYASGDLIRKGVGKNNNTNNRVWCTMGGLQVQGVLIGNNFENLLMKKSRSHLEKWFKDKSAKTVMNGASVVIEYSPSIFGNTTMPPGAEDFITALSVYKK